MFSRRHYRAIAKLVSELSLSDNECDFDGLHELELLRESIASQFATALKIDNAAFDRQRFIAACKGKLPALPEGVKAVDLNDPQVLYDCLIAAGIKDT